MFIKKRQQKKRWNCRLNVIKLINKPTAAAIVYGFNNYEENKIIMVFDLVEEIMIFIF